MLALRPNCECCDKDPAADSREAMVSTYECTFCQLRGARLGGRCPNCGRHFSARPVPAMLARHPASAVRVHADPPCPAAA